MNCSEFKEQVGAYAVGALSTEETAAMDAHLAQTIAHEGCQEALLRAQRAAGALSLALPPVHPGEHVWPAIESRVGKPDSPARRTPFPRREILAWCLAAAAAAFAVRAFREREELVERVKRTDQHLTDLIGERARCLNALETMKAGYALKHDALALLDKPSTRVVPLAPVAGKPFRASAIVNLAERRAIVVSSSMPRQAGKDFELWVIRGKNHPPDPAGFLRTAEGGVEIGEIDPRLLGGPEPHTFAVSIEPLGGRPTPTEVLVAGALHG